MIEKAAHDVEIVGHDTRLGIGIGVDGHGLDAEAVGGACHAAGNFATVGNQDFLEHGLFPQASQAGWRFCRKD